MEVEEQDHSWKLTLVNQARSWSPNKDLLHPVYVLTRKGNPFQLQSLHGVLEVSWGHRYWVTAVALPRWINTYNCLGLVKNACGPILDHHCAMWCDNTRLSEELIECSTGSFVQVHVEALVSDLVRIDLQAALERSIATLHLPVKRLSDNQVMMKVFVPHGCTCFSGTSFVCISEFENWQAVLMAAGRRAYPCRNPDSMVFYRVHSAIEEVSAILDPITKHFILADANAQEHTRTVVFAIFTSQYEFVGACHWTRVTKVWDIFDLCGGTKGWVIYHNNQRLRHHRVSVHHGDYFACYERWDLGSPIRGDLTASTSEAEVAPLLPDCPIVDAPASSQVDVPGVVITDQPLSDAVSVTSSTCLPYSILHTVDLSGLPRCKDSGILRSFAITFVGE